MSHETFAFLDDVRRCRLDRRAFLRGLGAIAGGGAATAAFGQIVMKTREGGASQVVEAGDPRLGIERIEYPGETGPMKAYFARTKDEAKRPGVVIIHENRGLNPHTEDVARRVALEGYLALAPDALSPLGGTPDNVDEARGLFQKLEAKTTTGNFVAAVRYLKTHPLSTGKVACMGFCWGGGVTNQVAVHSPDLTGAVPFYGMQPAAEDVPKIKASLLLHYAGLDDRIDAGIPAFEAALKAAKVEYLLFMYDGARHAFFNDTNSQSYNKEAADLAWKRTLDFFAAKLRT